jgi:uncharacterized protein (DUF362 family)
MTKLFLTSLLECGYKDAIAAGLGWLNLASFLKAGDRVFIKPNLTFPHYRPGVMTNPDALKAVVEILKDYTQHITICESDSGGYNRFSMDDVFRETGISRMADRYGVRVLNTSFSFPKEMTVRVGLKTLNITVAREPYDECDLFITMPVPKIHMYTKVSLSLKNQWGLIQKPRDRLKLHPFFPQVIYAVNKALPRTISIVDGRYGLNRSGPLRGDVLDLNWLIVADNIFAADFVCTTLMQLNPLKISYLHYALKREGITSFSSLQFNTDYRQFRSPVRFYLKRSWTDYPGFFAFHSRMLAHVGYESVLAPALHRLLYLFREPFYDYNFEASDPEQRERKLNERAQS